MKASPGSTPDRETGRGPQTTRSDLQDAKPIPSTGGGGEILVQNKFAVYTRPPYDSPAVDRIVPIRQSRLAIAPAHQH